MKLTPRLFLSLAGLSFATLSAVAQHEPYITEADVTLELTFGTHLRKGPDTSGVATTTPVTSRLTNRDVIQQLINNGTLPSGTVSDWKLVAVRAAPADVYYVNGNFYLYALKTTESPVQRVALGEDIFGTSATFYSAKNYVERHQGLNVISSRGTINNYTAVSFTPPFTSTPVTESVTVDGKRVVTKTSSRYELNSLGTAGYATLTYATRSAQPIFFCAIESLRYNALGDFVGTQTTTIETTTTPLSPPGSTPSVETVTDPTVPGFGLVSMRINVGPAKLVRQSDYPEVPYF